jgi:acetylornithine deacetylase/succinyl-diaminopimelate desuccinylase-like protein
MQALSAVSSAVHILIGIWCHVDLTLMSPHSPDERANIPSVAKCWEFLQAVLENIPVK